MKTTIISFSSRKNGNCAQIGKLIQSMKQESALFDFSEFEVHTCGECNYECFENREACAYIDDMEYKMLETITQSEMVYFFCPTTVITLARITLFSTNEANVISKAGRSCRMNI